MEAFLSTLSAFTVGAALAGVLWGGEFMTKWKHEKKPVQPEPYELRRGPVMLTVREAENGRRWQSVNIFFSIFSDAPMEQCLQTWPREAVKYLRAAIDKFETSIEDEGA